MVQMSPVVVTGPMLPTVVEERDYHLIMRTSRRKSSSGQPAVLFVFKNPYVFETSMIETVRELAKDHSVSVLVANYYVPKSLLTELRELSQSGKICEFSVIPAYRLPKTVDGLVTRSWFCETLFWIARYTSTEFRKFDILVSHTGASISDWLPLMLEGNKGAEYLCAFPVRLPPANHGGQTQLSGNVLRLFKPSDLRQIARRVRSKMDSGIDRTMVRALATFSRGKLQVQVPMIGNFRFDRYLVATTREYANLLGRLEDAVVEVVDFPNAETAMHRKPKDSTLLLLLDMDPPTGEYVDRIEYTVDWICTTLSLNRITVRPHPRDSSTFPDMVLDRLSRKYESELALPRDRTLTDSVSSSSAVAGGISASVDDCIRVVKGLGSGISVFRVDTCEGKGHRHETRLPQSNCCIEKLWPTPWNPSDRATENTDIRSLADVIRNTGGNAEA